MRRAARVLLTCTLCVVLVTLPGWSAGLAGVGGTAISTRGGRWSDPDIWNPRGVPGKGTRVKIARGTTVEYDVAADRELGELDIEGTITFSRDRSTRLDTQGIVIRSGGVLELGKAGQPIPRTATAEIRLVVPEGRAFVGGGFVPGDVGIWVLAGGRWEVQGEPVRNTWVKLAHPARVGESAVVVARDITDWPIGADVVLTATGVNPTAADFEERTVRGVQPLANGLFALQLTAPLSRAHDGGSEFSGEVALLSRNVRISSKYPQRTKAHTVYMAGAKGSIAYGEFKDLGALGVLGRYPIHFHLLGESSRGMSVRGASIWRSDNHFMNIHGSNGIAVVDTVGYDTAGNGFFLEPVEMRGGPPGVERRGKDQELPQPMSSASPRQDKTQTREQRRQKQREAGNAPRKGENSPGNVGILFLHNLAAKGFWRPGSLDEPRRIALFWIASLNTILVDNVAVGAQGGRDNSGFHLAEGQDYSPAAAPLTMVRNEAHSNRGHGFFSWTNNKVVLDVVGFRAWRNGRTGMSVGAYNNRLRIFRASLSENGQYNLNIWVVRSWLQDSALARAPVGIFFSRHHVNSDPEDPTVIVNTSFAAHPEADVSQDHRPCALADEERQPTSRRCAANYALFVRPTFSSGRAIDFGWQQNANSWIEIQSWLNPPPGVPSSVRLVRRDQQGEGTSFFPRFDARVRSARRVVDMPPSVDLTVATNERSGAGVVLRAQPRDDRGVVAVEFFADGVMLRRVTTPPYEVAWSPGPQARQTPVVYARAFDSGGNLAYSQVLPVVLARR